MAERVAIVHDWLNGMRGGEKVLEEMLLLFPDADIFTLFLEREKISQAIAARPIFTSRLNRWPGARRHYRYLLPLFPRHIESFNLQEYRLVLSISHCAAKGVVPAPEALHVSYVNSPMRFAWDQFHAYFGRLGRWRQALVRRQISRLRLWDVASSARVDHFIANSSFIRQRIEKYYRREAAVIHPPVDTDFFQPAANPSRDFFLAVSALVPYKRLDLVVDAFSGLKERLVVVGRGGEEARLRRRAGKNIEFRRQLPAPALRELYQNARGLVFAGVEDFGMFFVEALACGTPVVAYGRGGVLDIVENGRQGVLFSEPTPQALCRALADCTQARFEPAALRQSSLRFSRENFRVRLRQFLAEKSQR